jgi:hypothetical protein
MRSMKAMLVCSFLMVLALPLSVRPASAADQLSGEVLDMSCYLAKGAHGPAHAACAQACAEHGMPLGLLTDDQQVYLLYPKHGKDEAFDAVKKLAGQRATITGIKSERSGIKGMEVSEATAATAAK